MDLSVNILWLFQICHFYLSDAVLKDYILIETLTDLFSFFFLAVQVYYPVPI